MSSTVIAQYQHSRFGRAYKIDFIVVFFNSKSQFELFCLHANVDLRNMADARVRDVKNALWAWLDASTSISHEKGRAFNSRAHPPPALSFLLRSERDP